MSARIRPPAPAIPPVVTIDAADLPHLEALASGAMSKAPDLADRLLHELSRARVLDSADMPGDVVRIGNRVTYRDESNGREMTVALVWPEEADIAAGRVSVATPIGVALLGLPAGARFSWQTRTGQERDLTIVSVDSDVA